MIVFWRGLLLPSEGDTCLFDCNNVALYTCLQAPTEGPKNLRNLRIVTIFCGTALIASSASAENNKPAVAAPNGKIEASAGSVGLETAKSINGSYSIPITHSVGVQLDAGLSDGVTYRGGGLAGHAFYRNPEKFLAGVTTLWVRTNGRDIFRHGVEGEFYDNTFTYSASAGMQMGLSQKTGYISLEAGHYLNDDLFVRTGGQGHSNYRSLFGGVEWRPDNYDNLSLFSDVGAGNRGGGFGIFGLRYAFGSEPISLRKQHREYDPPNIIGYFNGGGANVDVKNTIESKKPVVLDGGEL